MSKNAWLAVAVAILLIGLAVFQNASAQSLPCDIECAQLDFTNHYMVIVRPPPGETFPDDWRARLEIESQIKDCFEAAGFERGDIGVLFLDGFDIEIIQVDR
jgi:hypothetical protein